MKTIDKLEKKTFRCAIYTRKSVAEGLEKDFNTLDAQREAGENYVSAQKNEGWTVIEKHYDDGGFTGGNMERPALRELFEDIKAGMVDIVVVYKVDRLSRSLTDFAKIVELFEAHNVSFVSVTQHFNTKDSMGRLTLNILLSFAQFERELISERTRDKMAAARRRGKWVGGMPILGYDIIPNGGGLKINQAEAENVRTIFKTYLEKRSVLQTLDFLNENGIVMKSWRTQKGYVRGGKPFCKSSLYYFLKNCTYAGRVNYKGEINPAEFEAIIDNDTFDAVQEQLKFNFRERATPKVRMKMEGLLSGKLYCGHCNRLMGHRYTRKTENKSYRYYVCQTAINSGWKNCPYPSLPAAPIENFVKEEISRISKDEKLAKEVADNFTNATRRDLTESISAEAAIEKSISEIREEMEKISDIESVKMEDLQRSEFEHQKALDICREKTRVLQQIIEKSRTEIERIFSDFDCIWENLNFKEKYELVDMLIEKVTYYGESSEVVISYRENGIKLSEGENGDTK